MKNAARARFLAAVRRASSKDEELANAQEAYLRASGWALTCDTPGSRWLWARPYRGRTLLVGIKTAVDMQNSIDSGVYPADAEPSDGLARMRGDLSQPTAQP
jgi:hypothetical protein